jgi:hypothetical protein
MQIPAYIGVRSLLTSVLHGKYPLEITRFWNLAEPDGNFLGLSNNLLGKVPHATNIPHPAGRLNGRNQKRIFARRQG